MLTETKAYALLRTALRLSLIIIFALLVHFALTKVQTKLAHAESSSIKFALTGFVVAMLFLYAILMAIPFVPGVEIGLSLLMMQGAKIAPFVFLATFLGLAIAYLVGRFLPYRILHDLFFDLGIKPACRLLERIRPLNQSQRIDLMQENLPSWLGKHVIRYRYLTIALALNIPGNAFIGGGGGIAMLAGLSGLFGTIAIMICFALAVAPIPLIVYFFGFDLLPWLG